MVAHGEPERDAERLRSLAAEVRPALPELVARVGERIARTLPALVADADLRQALTRSIEANLVRFFELLDDPALPVDADVPPDALALGSMLLRRGVEPGALVQAYLVGQNEFWRLWMAEIGRRTEGPEFTEVLELSSVRLTGWIDFVVEQLMRQWDLDRQRWVGGVLARRGDLVRALLAGGGPSATEASRALGYALDQWVLAAVLWSGDDREDPAAPLDELETAAAALARAAGASRALTLPVGPATLWAWVVTPEPPDLDRLTAVEELLRPGQGIALGRPGEALEGFRVGHDEALHARRIAELAGRAGVVCYERVEAVSLVSADLDRLSRFVRSTLGELAATDEPTARLRETLLAWLAEGGNARRAAERLHAHKNTVLYRIQRAQQILDRPLDRDRLPIELALTAMEQLGDRAVGRAP